MNKIFCCVGAVLWFGLGVEEGWLGRGSLLAEPTLGFEQVQSLGSGCPPESTQSSLTSSGDSILLKFSSLATTSHLHRQGCSFGVRVQVPSGYQARLQTASYVGSLHLERSEHAVTHSLYSFPAGSSPYNTHVLVKHWNGEHRDNPLTVDEVVNTPWADCGQSLPLIATIAMKLTGNISRRSVLKYEQVTLKFAVRECAPP